jgi:hypothetical protein
VPQHAEYQEMSYCNSVKNAAKDNRKIAVIYHDVTKWNHVRYCTVPYIDNLIPLPFSNTTKIIEAFDKYDHFILIDSAKEELEEYSLKANRDIYNGVVY